MSSQIFPNVEEILDILFAELPSGVFAEDRADNIDPNKRSISSSEIRAHAQMLANIYSNLEGVYLNKFLVTLQSDGTGQWNQDLFSQPQDNSLPFINQQQKLLAKFRASGGISLPAISILIHGILDPVGIPFAILPYSGQVNDNGDTGAWILAYSSLGQNTYLSTIDPIMGAQSDFVPLDCDLNYSLAGITLQQLQDIQMVAYTYGIYIYGNADANTILILDTLLTDFEPARSTHVIFSNATPPIPPS